MKGSITRRAQARRRRAYDHRVLIEQTGATLSVRLPLGTYTDDGERLQQKVLGFYYRRLERILECFNVSYRHHCRA